MLQYYMKITSCFNISSQGYILDDVIVSMQAEKGKYIGQLLQNELGKATWQIKVK